MNRTILADRIWKVYSFLPHCQILTRWNKKKARDRFDYTNKKDISIIAVNCIGGEIYSILKLPFLSPFINTAMNRKQFITMCEHLKEYMAMPLKLSQLKNGRTVGVLGSAELPQIEIFFEH